VSQIDLARNRGINRRRAALIRDRLHWHFGEFFEEIFAIKTYAEQGFLSLTAASWVGLFAPAKTDPVIISRLNAAVQEVLNDPAVQKNLQTIGTPFINPRLMPKLTSSRK